MRDERLEGYVKWEGVDRFEDYVGPFYFREDGDTVRCALISEEKHINGQQGLHGGFLMTFADYSLFAIARKSILDVRAVTISFSSEFVGTAGVGEFVEAIGEVVRETGSLIFVRGQIVSGSQVLLNYSGVMKKMGPRKK